MPDTAQIEGALAPPDQVAPASRSATLARLAELQFDILVIGGGITGAGVARDAAMRGLGVALVEGADFASGTSSRSSRLIHGGVRYLEHGQLHLVFEACRERRILASIAPHLVRPLQFMWPVYEKARIVKLAVVINHPTAQFLRLKSRQPLQRLLFRQHPRRAKTELAC